MAKCVVDKDGRVKRVSSQEAREIVERGGYYISKGEYGRALAGAGLPPPPRQAAHAGGHDVR